MTREEQIIRGNEAARLLSDPILIEAFTALEADAFEKLISAPAGDDETRRDQAHRVRVIRDLRDELKSVITTGKQAALTRS